MSVLQTDITTVHSFHKVCLYLLSRDPGIVPQNELCPHDKAEEWEALITSKCLACQHFI